MTSLDVADLVVIGGRVLGIGTTAALERLDPQAAETALAEAPMLLSLPDSYAAAAACAGLMSGLLQHPRPGPARRARGGAGLSIDGRMLARFSDHAAAAVFMARQEARRLGHGSVDPEHLLLGLIRVGEGTGISALDRLGVSREALRRQLEESIGHGPERAYGPVRFSRPRGQKVLSSALPEALVHGTTDICTAHLLLAQYHDDGPASGTLARLGATEDRVRDTVAALRAQPRKGG